MAALMKRNVFHVVWPLLFIISSPRVLSAETAIASVVAPNGYTFTLSLVTKLGGPSPDLLNWSDPVRLLRDDVGNRLYYGPWFYHDERFIIDGGRELYFNLSEWERYNVYLVKMTISP